MQAETEFRYRIIYEALSNFSNAVNKCLLIDDLAACLEKSLKYLFDFHTMRYSFYKENRYYYFDVTPFSCTVTTTQEARFFQYEHFLLRNELPVQKHAAALEYMDEELKEKFAENIFWGWHFHLGINSGIVVSIFTDTEKAFSKKDIPILKLATEALYSKVLSLCLFKELDEKKTDLEAAIGAVQKTNERIVELVEHQERIIQSRTKEIEEKNHKLFNLCNLNAHQVREPLTRITGLISLIDYEDVDMLKEQLIPRMLQSATDLDKSLQLVIEHTNSELFILTEKDVLYEKNNAG